MMCPTNSTRAQELCAGHSQMMLIEGNILTAPTKGTHTILRITIRPHIIVPLREKGVICALSVLYLIFL